MGYESLVLHAGFDLPDPAAAGVAKECENTPLGWKRCDLTWSHAGRPARCCARDDRLAEKRCGGESIQEHSMLHANCQGILHYGYHSNRSGSLRFKGR